MPPKPQPQHQAPQAYQSIPRPMYAPSLPVYIPSQQQPLMPIQAAPHFLQITPSKKDKQGPGDAKTPLQLQGMVFTYPYAPQPYQPAPVPPVYMPQYYQPTVQQPRQHSNTKGKENEKEKEKESSKKSHEKTPQVTPAPSYPFMGYAPQGYVPQGFVPQTPLPLYPKPVPPPQTTWRIKLYRPVLTIARPPAPAPLPFFNQGYPVLNQPYPVPGQQFHPQTPVPQPASPGLRPIGQRPGTPQVIRPPTGFPLQPLQPLNTYRPAQVPYAYPAYPTGQVPQRFPWQPVQKMFQPTTCQAPCPDYCAPACNPMCCKDRK